MFNKYNDFLQKLLKSYLKKYPKHFHFFIHSYIDIYNQQAYRTSKTAQLSLLDKRAVSFLFKFSVIELRESSLFFY